jgi:transcriptional regulator with XRE-family HTH domain
MSSLINQYQLKKTEDGKTFFEQLGQRIARLRKEQSITQVQLAEKLSISQQHMASFEKGIRKIPASMLPNISQILNIPLEDLFGISDSKAIKRGPTPKLQRQVELISQLPKTKQRFVMDMLDTVIQQTL